MISIEGYRNNIKSVNIEYPYVYNYTYLNSSVIVFLNLTIVVMFEKNAAENYELNWIVNPANNVKFNKHTRLRDQLKQPSNCELLDSTCYLKISQNA